MNEACEVAVAALLHDVGKVLQRARRPLSSQAERMTQMLCRTDPESGRSTHRHVLWTSDFLEWFVPRLPGGFDAARIRRLAAGHHRASQPDEWLIAEADCLASGHDRRPDEESPAGRSFRQVPLESVFCRVGLDGAERSGAARAWLPGELRADESILPGEPPDAPDVEAAWAPLADTLEQAADALDLRALPAGLAVQAVLGLSERFQSLVPASARDRPDVSLHDHAAVTAALACAALRYHRAHDDFAESSIRDRTRPKYRFVVGSLAGIQPFIFAPPDRPRKGIARTFRAKSFYVSAVTRAVVLRLLEALRLPATNCVLHAGGRFVILADSSEPSRKALEAAAAELDRWFLENHLGTLGLRLAWDVTASGSDMLGERFPTTYRQVENLADRAKFAAMGSCLRADGGWSPGRFLHTSCNVSELADRDHEQAVALGKCLPRARCMGFYRPDRAPEGLLKRPRDCCGLAMQLGEGSSLPAEGAVLLARIREDGPAGTWLPHEPQANHVPILDAADVQRLGAAAPAPAEAAEDQQDDDQLPAVGRPATFEHLAALSTRPRAEGSAGRPMLACLKADLDRLGLLLARGLREDISFARVASCSRWLDLFFKGYLTCRMTRPDSPYRHIYTVFAGGDDLMLIGPWGVMFDFAAELRDRLDELSGGNPDVTLSAALVLSPPRMPPSHMARRADALLDRAKEAGRNRLAVLGRVMTWPQFDKGLEIGRRLDAMTARRDGDPRDRPDGLELKPSFLYRLLQYARSAERVAEAARRGRDIRMGDLMWRSHFLYDLARNVRRSNKDPTDRQQRDMAWLEGLLAVRTGSDHIAPIILGTTYALYLNRGA